MVLLFERRSGILFLRYLFQCEKQTKNIINCRFILHLLDLFSLAPPIPPLVVLRSPAAVPDFFSMQELIFFCHSMTYEPCAKNLKPLLTR